MSRKEDTRAGTSKGRNSEANNARAAKSFFLTASDGEVEKFFDRLKELPSPLKEEFLVEFCLESSKKEM